MVISIEDRGNCNSCLAKWESETKKGGEEEKLHSDGNIEEGGMDESKREENKVGQEKSNQCPL